MVRFGTLLAVTAYVFWGLSPIFWKLLAEIPAGQQVAMRILFAFPVLVLILRLRKKPTPKLSRGTVVQLVVASAFLFVNWALFIWAISVDRIVDTSLGYYINPLVSVLLGVVILGERMRRLQWTAVGFAAVGVLYLTIKLGTVPWLSIAIAVSFGLYGLLKKRTPEADALHGLAIETSWLAVASLVFLIFSSVEGSGPFVGASTGLVAAMVLSGAVTIFPLWLFGKAAHAIPLSSLGVLQYLTPTFSLLVGVMLYGEAMAGDRLVGFMLVWLALAVFAYDSVRHLAAE